MTSSRHRTARFSSFLAAAFSLIGLVALHAGCTKVPLVAPSGTVITLIATTNLLPLNGAADIIAVLVENGTTATTGTGGTATTPPSTGNPVHNGTLVSFTTTLGRVEPAEAKTANGGQVTVQLIATGVSGVATITAYSGGASKTMTVNIGAAGAARILVSASPQTLPFTGGTASVKAVVQDQQGNAIAGVPVTFSTTAGSLGFTTAVTDSSGFATTTISTSANATVTASAGGGTTGTLSGTAAITLLANSTVTFTPPTTAVASSSVLFSVAVGAGVAASEVFIDFGDGDGLESLGAVTSQSVSHVYGREGSYAVKLVAYFVDGTVKEQRSTVVVQSWNVSASCGPNVTFVSGQSTVTATITPATSIAEFNWNFGSGEGTAKGNPTQHVWQSRGTKTVTVTAVPLAGSGKSATCQLEVT